MFTDLPPPPLSLYVHVPWCLRKCPYCDFNSHPVGEVVPFERYVDALLADLEAELPNVWGRRLDSVFIGGGTPSLFSPESIDRLISGIRARLPLRPDAEVTMEANPGAVEHGRFNDYRYAGITRLSLGVQSFDDDLLARIGRIHSGEEAQAAAGAAREAGFAEINLDLMFGLPGQSIDQCLADLARAAALGPSHLSWYQLTLEPETPFHARPPELPDEDLVAAMQTESTALLQAQGFTQYEVSAWSSPGHECRHNLNYWTFGDYIGIGAGAHGKLSFPSGGILRRWKVRLPERYMTASLAGNAASGEVRPAAEEVVLEFMMNALRLTEGFEASLFAERTGLPFVILEPGLNRAQERGLADVGERIVPTELGRRFLDDLVGCFVVDGS